MVFIIIKPQNYQLTINFDSTTSISKLNDSIVQHYNLQNNIEEWICFSETRKEKLNNNDDIQDDVNEKLIIFTYSSKRQTQNQYNQNQEITLFLNIEFNSQKKQIQRLFQNTASFQDLKDLALAECSLLFQKDYSIEMSIFGQILFQPNLDSMQIKQMQLRQNSTIDITIINHNSDEENNMLAQLQNMDYQCNQIVENIYEQFENIRLKVDIIIRNAFDQLNQFLEQIKTNINLAQKNIRYLNDLNQIDNISAQISNINLYLQNIETQTNIYTEKIIQDQEKIVVIYNNSSKPMSMPPTATIKEVINYLKLININFASELRFSNKLIHQLDLNEQLKDLVNHTLYIDRLKIQIKQSTSNQKMKEVQVFY